MREKRASQGQNHGKGDISRHELQIVGEERFQKQGRGGHWGQGLQEKQELRSLFEFSRAWASSQSQSYESEWEVKRHNPAA